MLYPPPPQTDNEVPSYRTLFQAEDGIGAHVAIDPSATLIGIFDEPTNTFTPFYFDFQEMEEGNGWTHVVVTFDSPKHQSKLSINGKY